MPRYIRVNTLKQTLLEDLRIARSWKVIFLWINKLLRVRIEGTSPIPISVPFQDFQVQPEQVSSEAVARLIDPLRDASTLGFLPPLYQVVVTLKGESVSTTATCLHQQGEMVLRLMHCRLGTVQPPKEVLAVVVYSRLTDGRLVVTTSRPPSYNSDQPSIVQRRLNGSVTQITALHQSKLQQLRAAACLEKVSSLAALTQFIDRVEMDGVDPKLKRGLYEEVSLQEIQAAPAAPSAGPEVVQGDLVDAAFLNELTKQQNTPSGWSTAIFIGILSFVLFLASGGLRWNWRFAGLLAGVVLFHELGHFVAMRSFGYRNLRMFFIPLLGAAVSGRHYNVKGWQQALVSLAGPVPGIILGLVLAGVALVSHHVLLWQAAFLCLVLNGINLLPFLPLDGGWVLNALVFSRHYLLESVFRAVAGVALITATIMGQGRLWMYLGIAILAGLPISYQLARITSRLRAANLDTNSPDGLTIPPATALAILQELKANLPGTRHTKQLVGFTADIFGRLNANPPRSLATSALLALYLLAGACVWLPGGFLWAKMHYGGFGGTDPVWSYVPGSQLSSPVGALSAEQLTMPCLVANCSSTITPASFSRLAAQLGKDERLDSFGRTLLLSGPAITTNRARALGLGSARLYLESPASNNTSIIYLRCKAPTDSVAKQLEAELGQYFGGAWLNLWPPWVDQTNLPSQERSGIERKTHTWAVLQDLSQRIDHDSGLQKLDQQLEEESSTNKLAALRAEWRKTKNRLRQGELTRALAAPDPLLDRGLVELWADYAQRSDQAEDEGEADNRSETARERLRDAFACWPTDHGHPGSLAGWQSTRMGMVTRTGSVLSLPMVSFHHTAAGLPALVAYLERSGCTAFRYSLANY